MCRIFLLIVAVHAVCADPTAQQMNDFLETANELRQQHGSPSLTLNGTLTQYAQDFANELANSDELRNSNGPYGENVYWTGKEVDTQHAVRDKWYAQSANYDYSNEAYSTETGSFTQLIWKDTTDVGLGIATSPASGKSYMVASFWPQGNQEGKYANNVQQLGSQQTSTEVVEETTTPEPETTSRSRFNSTPRSRATTSSENSQEQESTQAPRTSPPPPTTQRPATPPTHRTASVTQSQSPPTERPSQMTEPPTMPPPTSPPPQNPQTPQNPQMPPPTNAPQNPENPQQNPQFTKPPVGRIGDLGAHRHMGPNKVDPDFLGKLSEASG